VFILDITHEKREGGEGEWVGRKKIHCLGGEKENKGIKTG